MTTSDPTHRIDHRGTESADIEAEVDFLVNVMGMTLMRWGVHAGTGKRIALLHDAAASKVELMEVDSVTGELDHIAFAVEDLHTAHGQALRAGCTEERGPFRIDAAGADTSFVRTNGGELLQLIRYDADSPDRRPWG